MGLMKKLTSAIVASSLVFSLVGTAAAAYSPTTEQAAGTRMQTLGIINGKPGVGLALNDEITRAELVTTIVRAFGKEQDAALLKGSTVFPDITNHWASGNIAMAAALVEKAGGDAIGMPDGKFNPDGKLTPAQAVAFLMKFIGVKRDASKAWPNDYLDQAVKVGLITADDAALIAPKLNENATRGLVFYMFDRAFYSYDLGAGKTFYTKYVDTQGPELTVNPIDATTIDSKVTVTGKVSTDANEVYVGTTKVTVDANGNFSSDFALPEVKADAYSITVTARDVAGNPTTQTLKVTRTTGVAASIEADAVTVAANGTATVKAVVKDAKGNVLANQTVTGTSTLGAFDGTTFTAGKTTGTGTLTLAVGDLKKDVAVTVTAGGLDHVDMSAASVAPGVKVTLTAKDAAGNTVTGATFTQTSADALVDSTNGTFIASKAGQYTVTATAGGVSKTVTVGVYDTTVASYSVTWGASSLVANNASTTTLTIKALDKFGNVVANSTAGAIDIAVNAGAFQYNTDGGSTFTADLNAVNDMALTNGVATLTVRTNGALGGTTGKVTVTKGDSTLPTSATISLVDQVATSISVINDDQFLASNNTSNATYYRVKVLDQDGKTMRSGYYPITLALNSGVNASIVASGTYDYSPASGATTPYTVSSITAATSTTVYYDGFGFATGGTVPAIKVTPNFTAASGTVTVSGTATGLTTGSKDVTMQFAGQAAKLNVTASSTNVAAPVAGTNSVTYNVQVTDAAGVPVAAQPGSVVAAFTGITNDNRAAIQVTGSVTLPSGATYVNPTADKFEVPLNIASDGTASFTVAVTSFTGNLGFVVRDNAASNALVAAPAQSVTLGAGAVASVSYTVNTLSKTSVNVPAGADALTVVARLKDGNGNNTTVSSGSLKLAAAGVAATGAANNDITINGTAGSGTATFAADGTATFTVKAGSFVGGQYTLAFTGTYVDANGATKTFGATGAATLPTTNLTLNVQNSVASAVSVALYAESAHSTLINTVDAANSANVFAVATVTDNAGRKVADEYLKVYTVNSDGTTTLVARTVPTGTSLTTDEVAAGVTAVTNVGDGTYTFAVKANKAPGVTFKVVTNNSVNPANAQFTVGVRPDYTTGATRSVAFTGGSSQDITKLTEKAVTINLVDAYGNAVVNNSGTAKDLTLTFTKAISGNPTATANVQVRTASGGLSGNTVSIANGAQSVTVYLVTDEAVGTTITATVGGATGMGLTGSNVITLNVK